MAGRPAGWLENLILMKTQSSVWTWTWTLDFDLGFVKTVRENEIELIQSQAKTILSCELSISEKCLLFFKVFSRSSMSADLHLIILI